MLIEKKAKTKKPLLVLYKMRSRSNSEKKENQTPAEIRTTFSQESQPLLLPKTHILNPKFVSRKTFTSFFFNTVLSFSLTFFFLPSFGPIAIFLLRQLETIIRKEKKKDY